MNTFACKFRAYREAFRAQTLSRLVRAGIFQSTIEALEEAFSRVSGQGESFGRSLKQAL